jgi:ABC-type multidrug transport system ATPase subunit
MPIYPKKKKKQGEVDMNISSIYVQNFRKLQQCHIDFSNNTTLFVGANNSGKTSAMDALGKFLAGRGFVFMISLFQNVRPLIQLVKNGQTKNSRCLRI